MSLAVVPPALAQSDRVALHGYGHLQTTLADAGDEDQGTGYDFSLLGTVRLSERVRLWGQGAQLSKVGRPRLDWAFLELRLAPTSTLYVGQARTPVALSNELRDVQALRASASLPALYEDEVGLVDESVRGAVFERRLGKRPWGEVTLEAFGAAQVVPDAEDASEGAVGGGRITWARASGDLAVKLSGYGGRVGADRDDGHTSKSAVLLSSSFNRAGWTVTGEVGRGQITHQLSSVGYLQAERALTSTTRLFVRGDAGRTTVDGWTLPRYEALAVGGAYQARYWGVRVEWGQRRGALHAEEPVVVVPADLSRYVSVAANYIF